MMMMITQNNILIDDNGAALITDFGVSSVVEDFPSSEPGSLVTESFFGGAVRWMAPELISALVEDDGRKPELTKSSDVYAFASVCLEVCVPFFAFILFYIILYHYTLYLFFCFCFWCLCDFAILMIRDYPTRS